MKQEEVNQRNEAIAFFLGWIKNPITKLWVTPDGRWYGSLSFLRSILITLDIWEKIGKDTNFDEQHFIRVLNNQILTSPSTGIPIVSISYVWRVNAEEYKYEAKSYTVGKGNTVNLATALWLTVSDFCISYQEVYAKRT